MHTLFLDIASHEGLLACSTEERVLAHRAIDHRIGDHELVPLMEDVLREAGWSYKDLTHLVCVIGPGGFTSLRVGVSCINALSWALKVPVAGIHLSDLYGARVVGACHPSEHLTMTPCEPRTGDISSFLWLHSTKRTELFIRGFGDLAKEWLQPMHITIDDLLAKFHSPTTYPLQPAPYVGELLPEHCSAIGKTGAEALSLRPLSGILPPFLSSLAYQTQVLQPWYGRGW